MPTEQNKAILQRWMDAFNEHDLDLLDRLADELYTADYVLHDPDFLDLPPGPAGVKQFVRSLPKNWTDVNVVVDELVAEGDRVASRFTVGGVDASIGKPLRLHGLAISRFADGKIAEEWQLAVPATSEIHDPIAIVKALDAACNAGDIKAVMAFFADDAVIEDPEETKLYTGKQQIREWFEPQMGHIHVISTNHRVAGNTVNWEATLTGDMVEETGRHALEETAEAVVQGGKITSFAPTIVKRRP